MTDFHRRHRLLDQDGQPIETRDIDIGSLPLLDHEDWPDLPASMELRLMAPAVILFHPAAEMSIEIPLPELMQGELTRYVEMMNVAVLRQAMGDTPPDERGYPVSD